MSRFIKHKKYVYLITFLIFFSILIIAAKTIGNFTKQYIIQASRVNPLRYSNVTTRPDYNKIIKQLFYGRILEVNYNVL